MRSEALATVETLGKGCTNKKGFGLLETQGDEEDSCDTHENKRKSLGKAATGAVASENPLCSKIGTDILDMGGNAVDAAIAAGFCIGTVQMYSSGIGGGGFMLIKTAGNEFVSLDFREQAPKSANLYNFQSSEDAQFGGRSVAVPGELLGMWEAFNKYGSGRVSWFDVIEGSVDLAENGWAVGKMLDKKIREAKEYIWTDNGMYDVFTRNCDRGEAKDFLDTESYPGAAKRRCLFKLNDVIARKKYGETLQIIQKGLDGINSFYYSSKPDSIRSHLLTKINGNIADQYMTAEDFQDYKVIERNAMHAKYGSRNYYSVTAPARFKKKLISVVALCLLSWVCCTKLKSRPTNYLT